MGRTPKLEGWTARDRVAGAFACVGVMAMMATIPAGGTAAPPSARVPGFPPGTTIVRFQVRDGLPHAPATLRSQSGRDTTGELILDTGAPILALRRDVFGALRPDTMVKLRSYLYERRPRPLASIEMGAVTVPDVPVGALIPDTLLDPLGIFPPHLFGDRGMMLDYEGRFLALVPRALRFVAPDTANSKTSRPGYVARVGRSRADFGRIVAPEAIGLPCRVFAGGRILVTARAEDSDASWRSPSLTLLLDTGASCCALFQASAERLTRAHLWPWLRDRRFQTAYGVIRGDHTVVPTLVFTEPNELRMDRVEMAVLARSELDFLQAELPDRLDGILGANVLARFHILIDSVNEILWLTPVEASHPGPPGSLADTGLKLEQRWGQMHVASVKPGSSASRQGVAFGDVVVSIDGIAMSSFEPDSAERLLRGVSGSEVTVIVRREGTERVLRLRREAAAREATGVEPRPRAMTRP